MVMLASCNSDSVWRIPGADRGTGDDGGAQTAEEKDGILDRRLDKVRAFFV